VPHFSNPYFYSDPTHRRFFGLYSFSYFAEDKIFSRTIPGYSRLPDLVLQDVQLRFYSPFRQRKRLKKFLGKIFVRTVYAMEFYEEFLSQLFPCYEIRYLVRKV
jgi:hypothetical protein